LRFYVFCSANAGREEEGEGKDFNSIPKFSPAGEGANSKREDESRKAVRQEDNSKVYISLNNTRGGGGKKMAT